MDGDIESKTIELATAGLSRDEEQEYMDAIVMGFCPECGNAVVQNHRGRRKKFCSEACRFAWKNKHPKPQNWKSTRVAVCPVCKKEFMAFREYEKKRKYCSRACANKGRASEKKDGAAVDTVCTTAEENGGV